MIGSLRSSGTITAVSLRLLYLILCQVLGLILLLGRSSSTNDVELLVLRDEGSVLRRVNPRPRLDRTDRAVLAPVRRVMSLAPSTGRGVRPTGSSSEHVGGGCGLDEEDGFATPRLSGSATSARLVPPAPGCVQPWVTDQSPIW